MKALEGVRILDMTHVQSGPTCTPAIEAVDARVKLLNEIMVLEGTGVGVSNAA